MTSVIILARNIATWEDYKSRLKPRMRKQRQNWMN